MDEREKPVAEAQVRVRKDREDMSPSCSWWARRRARRSWSWRAGPRRYVSEGGVVVVKEGDGDGDGRGDLEARVLTDEGDPWAERLGVEVKAVLRAVVGVLSSAKRSSLCASRVLPVNPSQLKLMPTGSPRRAQCSGLCVRALR